MAKKNRKDRNDPTTNHSLAIRNVMDALPRDAKAAEIVKEVKARYGHSVTPTLVYLVRSKSRLQGKPAAVKPARQPKMSHAAARKVRAPRGSVKVKDVVGCLRAVRALRKAAGSWESAVAMVRAMAVSE